MKKKIVMLFSMVFAFSLLMAACGDAGTAGTAASSKKVTATATMSEGEFPVEVTIDTGAGYSVVFENDGFLMFDGEFDDSTYPLVTATILTEEVYNKYIADNKNSDSFREDDGFIKYKSSIGEYACLYKIGDKIPFMMTFEKSVDGDKADEIIGCMEFNY